MDFQVVWSKRGVADLGALVGYISADDRVAARRFGDLIISKVDQLVRFPRIGRIVPEYRDDRLREIIVSPYRIVYEIDDDRRQLAVLRVWHGARGDLELQG